VQPFHVAAFVKDMEGHVATVKQHLAAIRMLFDWLVTGRIIDVNPAHAVRDPKYREEGAAHAVSAKHPPPLLNKSGGVQNLGFLVAMGMVFFSAQRCYRCANKLSMTGE
jgi:hypothetical protein